MKPVVVVGAGWSGAVVANRLSEAGVPVEVLERAQVVGGHSRVETLNGVVYEPNGPHLLHTADERVALFLERLGLGSRPYRVQPKTEIELADGELRTMSWPVQVDELETLPDWTTIKRELALLPARPSGASFEEYAVSLMGRRLYELFVEGYTRKQWGREPSALSSSFAPKRIDVRWDGNRDLFLDRWQWFPPNGVNSSIEWLLHGSAVTVGEDVRVDDLFDVDASAFVVTAPLDTFAFGETAVELEWRGVQSRSTFHSCYGEQTRTAAYVINRPSMRVPYTRTVETKHASGQFIEGTVVSEEYPGDTARHYPVATVDRANEKINEQLQGDVRRLLLPVPTFFCGRLANYVYINQDEAIMGAWDCADAVLATLTKGPPDE